MGIASMTPCGRRMCLLALIWTLALLPWSNSSAPATILRTTAARASAACREPGTGPGGVKDGIFLRLKASVGTQRIDGSMVGHRGEVYKWSDQSAQCNDVTRFKGDNQPELWFNVIGPQPALAFNGGTDGDILRGQLRGLAGDQPYTIFGVNAAWGTHDQNLFAIGPATPSEGISYKPQISGGGRALSHNDGQLVGPPPPSEWRIDTMRYTADNIGANRFLYGSGNLLASDRARLQLPADPEFSLGGFTDPERGGPFTGFLAEFIVYNRALSETERRKVESALALTYGLTLGTPQQPVDYLNSDNQVIWNGGKNRDYQHDVFGIGRDTNAGFYQTQAGVAEIGVEASEGFRDDQTFLLLGHNGAPLMRNEDVPQGYKQRLDRIWKVQASGSPGKVDVYFRLEQFDSAYTQNPAAFALLVSKTPEFRNATVVTDARESDHRITFNAVTLESGDYLALAYPNRAPGGVDQGLQVWLHGDGAMMSYGGMPAEDGGTVAHWLDSSGNGHHLHQYAPARQPTYVETGVNMLKSMRFDGHDLLTNDTLLPLDSNNYALFVVAQADQQPSQGAYISLNVGSNTSQPALTQLGDGQRAGIGLPESAESGPTVALPRGPFMLRAISQHGQVDLAVSSGDTSSGPPTGTPTGTNLGYMLGQSTSEARDGFKGMIAEVVVYSGTLTLDQQRRVESYLALKYGLTQMRGSQVLSYTNSLSTVVWDADTNAGYNNDVAGFGADYASNLDNNISPNFYSGDILKMTTLEPNDKPNHTLLIWGHNGAAVGLASGDVPAGFQQRLARVWKLQSTGKTDKLHPIISFDISTLRNVDISELNDFALLISDSPSFQSVREVIRGPRFLFGKLIFEEPHTEEPIPLQDGDYISLAYPLRPLSVPTVTAPGAGGLVNTSKPLIQGSAAPNTTISVRTAEMPLCTTLTKRDGQWSCRPDPGLPDGTHTISVAAELEGMRSPPTAQQFTIDTVEPGQPMVSTPPLGHAVPIALPLLAGTAEPGVAVTVRKDDVKLCHAAAADDGHWACRPAAPLPEGSHTVSVIASDQAGNHSPAHTHRFAVDTRAPAAPTIEVAQSIDVVRPTISGTAEPGSVLTLTLDLDTTPATAGDRVVYRCVVSAQGRWRVDTSQQTPVRGALPPGGLPRGSAVLAQAQVQDAAGHTSSLAQARFGVRAQLFLPLLRR